MILFNNKYVFYIVYKKGGITINNIAIIIGSSGTLGKQLVMDYLNNNYLVYAIYNKNKVLFDNENLFKYKYDVSKGKKYKNLIKSLKKKINSETKISIVYTCGIYDKSYVETFDKKELYLNINTHVTGFIYLFKNLLDILKSVEQTNIILIGTNLLNRKNKGGLYYVLSKGMQIQLIKQLSYEYSKYNILFNQFSPGLFLSNMNSLSKEKIKNIENNIPLKKICTKEEISKIILNFTDHNSLITGEEIIIDGGNTIGY